MGEVRINENLVSTLLLEIIIFNNCIHKYIFLYIIYIYIYLSSLPVYIFE